MPHPANVHQRYSESLEQIFLICPKPRLHVLSCWCLSATLVLYTGTPLCKRGLTFRSHLFPFLEISSLIGRESQSCRVLSQTSGLHTVARDRAACDLWSAFTEHYCPPCIVGLANPAWPCPSACFHLQPKLHHLTWIQSHTLIQDVFAPLSVFVSPEPCSQCFTSPITPSTAVCRGVLFR